MEEKWSGVCSIVCVQLVALALVLLGAYFDGGCGACENDAACDGLFGACVCSGNRTGTFC